MKLSKFIRIKTFIDIASVIVLFFVLINTVFAAVDIAPFNKAGSGTESPVSDVPKIFDIVKNIVVWIYRAFFVVAVIFLLMAAYNYLQGGTNPEKIKVAKGQIKYAVISIAIALIASGLSFIIAQFLGSGGIF